MIYIVPNYFIENKTTNFFEIENMFALKYILKQKNDLIQVRTTMHSMEILMEGSKVIHQEKNNIQINAQEICFLTQNNYFMSERLTNNLQYKSVIIYFNDEFIVDFIQKYCISLNENINIDCIHMTYENNINLKENINLLENYIDKGFENHFIKLKIEEIFLHVLRTKKKDFLSFLNTVKKSAKNRIKYIIESNIEVIQTLDDICAITRLSQSQIRRYIKKHYNQTPKIWIDKQRLQKAILLLQNTDKTISNISTECGYATVSWFIVQFKKYNSLTPKEFRHKV